MVRPRAWNHKAIRLRGRKCAPYQAICNLKLIVAVIRINNVSVKSPTKTTWSMLTSHHQSRMCHHWIKSWSPTLRLSPTISKSSAPVHLQTCFPCQAKNHRYGLIEKSYLWAKRIQLHLFLPKTKVSFFWRSKDISKCLELQNFLTIYNLEYRSQRTRTICYSSKRILHSYRRRTQWQEWLLPCSKYLDPFSWCFHDKFLFVSCFIRKEWLYQSVKSNEFSQCSYCELLDL